MMFGFDNPQRLLQPWRNLTHFSQQLYAMLSDGKAPPAGSAPVQQVGQQRLQQAVAATRRGSTDATIPAPAPVRPRVTPPPDSPTVTASPPPPLPEAARALPAPAPAPPSRPTPAPRPDSTPRPITPASRDTVRTETRAAEPTPSRPYPAPAPEPGRAHPVPGATPVRTEPGRPRDSAPLVSAPLVSAPRPRPSRPTTVVQNFGGGTTPVQTPRATLVDTTDPAGFEFPTLPAHKIIPPSQGGGGIVARVVTSSAEGTSVHLYENGPDQAFTQTVDVNFLGLDPAETLPVGTWIFVVEGQDDHGNTLYSSIVPMWVS